MMELSFERTLACSPAAAFALVTDPSRMNRWSSAHIEALERGDADHPAAVGATRRIHLPGWPRTVLDEVVVRSDPPHAFAYAVVSGPARDHLGEIAIEPALGGCVLRWRVRMSLAAPLELLVRRRLQPELDKSLDALVAAARGAIDDVAAPLVRALDDTSGLAELRRRALACRDEQRDLADELAGRGDVRHWFTRVYQHVSELQIESCDARQLQHPAWVLRLVERFHHYYRLNLVSAGDAPEAHWRRAFAAMRAFERRDEGVFRTMAAAVFHGMKAHIEEDLPRALAEVFADHYASRCDYARFRADYLLMAPVFRGAGDRLVAQRLEKREVPLSTRVLTALLPEVARDAWMARRMYDIPKQRRKAFERGERLAGLLVGRIRRSSGQNGTHQ